MPKTIFIVPYRNRPEQKFFFCKYMSFLLDRMQDFEIYFSHQTDERSFNRGATRNIGFLAMKDKYPEHYADMTFVFNDLDTMPFNRIFDYATDPGVVKHYYGFESSLGGIVVIKGADFERVNGYPNFWSWGLEDTSLQKRCLAQGLKIDRSEFHKIGSPQMLQLFDGVERIINKKDPHRLDGDDGSCGLSTITDLAYTFAAKSTNPLDNVYESPNAMFQYINIDYFATETQFEDDEYYTYDLREPTQHIQAPPAHKRTNRVNVQPTSWKNIPYYPTTEERNPAPTQVPVPPKKPHPLPAKLTSRSPPAPTMPPVAPSPANATHLAPTRHVGTGPRMMSGRAGKFVVTKPTFRQLRNNNISIFSPPELNIKNMNSSNVKYAMTKSR